ncbi:ABC transporter ATP-binding protein [Sphingobium sufflavum]|uniref:ABC transporter ATP-binding protein n=1 Tax=Sphingobium sufflavum TaxID=1129547 RepID=UPI001F1F8324|nr:ABC transporter ATP-binding protein [Sphingobium sufflavum]MCE7798742.1 ABC transporter ATP-binding protein [Sphingobium sufflavum]
MTNILSVQGLHKTYKSGVVALHPTDLDVRKGEIFALLGPNGAGKTTLISLICGLVMPSGGHVAVGGQDHVKRFRDARRLIGLVPQEMNVDIFTTPMRAVRLTRGLFGKKPDDAYLEQLLRDLSLWDKRDARLIELSGGMKRRVLIAKALSHEPEVLFLDEPTAGVDVELRRDMWKLVHRLRERGVTIILTTHYIEEAEEMADRVGVINKGRLLLVDDKDALMARMGKRQLIVTLQSPLAALPASLDRPGLALGGEGTTLTYSFDSHAGDTGIADLMRALQAEGIAFSDLDARRSSLEDIFVDLVAEDRSRAA